MDPVTLFRASWVYPVSSPPVEGGVVGVSCGRIRFVGTAREARRSFAATSRDLEDGVILPGLVNAHTHLDLSGLRGRVPRATGFLPWVRELLAAKSACEPEKPLSWLRTGQEEARRWGTAAVGDWSTHGDGPPAAHAGFPVRRIFHEVLGFGRKEISLPGEDTKISHFGWRNGVSLGVHAPHTTSPELLRAGKSWTDERSLPLSIHAAESAEEEEFVLSGEGSWREFLISRGQPLEGWSPPGCSPVQYLDRLNLLDGRTQCVHLTRVRGEDLALLHRRKVRVVLCPRSNQFITGNLPDLDSMLRLGFSPALGTDSLASSPDLSLWNEMAFTQSAFPAVAPSVLIRMATLNGAASLDLEEELGSLTPGRKAALLFLPLGRVCRKELSEAVVASRGKGMRWLENGHGSC